jgi:ubiquinone/menaquinone biosynthesis C-methylase UbiE/uncharacterized protein YbaR (Trm112 family)
MLFHGIELVCPACRSDLERSQSAAAVNTGATCPDDILLCASCGRTYPIILGIPDLRLWPDPYIGLEDDRAKGRMLANECSGLDFTESVELYYRITTAVPPFQASRFARSLRAAADRSRAMVHDLRVRTGGATGADLLDVGCGTAPLLVSAAQPQRRAVGVDIAFRWLVLAQKRLTENGVDAPLVCACVEALPFRDGAFDSVVGESTVEHLRDQQRGLSECGRVLRNAGLLFLSTPNRRSLGPDPHTGLPAGGWLPDAVTAWHVRRKGGVPPRRRLLTDDSLRRLLEEAGFEEIIIEPADVPLAQRASFGGFTRLAIDAYHLTKRMPGGTAALRALGPLLHAAARKPGKRSAS